MNPAASGTLLFLAGFALWALTSAVPMGERIREGWDRPPYWEIGLPLVFAMQVIVALFSTEKIARLPLWVLLGHVVAMVLIHPPNTGLGLLPLSIVFMGVPLYLLLLLAAFVGRMVRRLATRAL